MRSPASRSTAPLVLLLGLLAACPSPGDDDPDAAPRIDATLPPDGRPVADAAPVPDADPLAPDAGPCTPTVTAFAPEASPHVAEGTAVAYPTNPPTSGPHYPKWARWRRIFAPGTLARPYWVHNLEHGGVVFLYRCTEAGGCPDVVARLEALQASLPRDLDCRAATPTRTLIVGDDDLPAGVQVAAAAWGHAYTASCVDEASLAAFYTAHFGQAPEDFCDEGSIP